MNASDFNSMRGEVYPPKVNCVSYSSIQVLEFLKGRPWDDMALAWVHSLRPSKIRVVKDAEHTDAWTWRVTIYVDGDNNITSIRQEVEVWLPDGVEDGYDLRCKTEQSR